MNFKKISRFLKTRGALILTLSAILIGTLADSVLFNFLTTAWVGYLLAQRIPRDFFTSVLSSIVLGASILLAFAGLFITLLWITNIDLSLHYILYGTLLLATLVTLKFSRLTPPTTLIDSRDGIALATIALYICAVFIGMYRQNADHGSFNLVESIAQTVTYGIDDISHLMMYQDTIEADEGLLLGSQDVQEISKTATAAYPKMSHTLAGLLVHGGQAQGTAPVLLLYTTAKYAMFFTALFVLIRASLEAVRSKKAHLFTYAIAIPLTTFFTFFLTHIFIEEGFFSVWPILLYSPLILLLLKNIASKESDATHLYIAAAMATVVTMSWPIMGLPLYAALFIYIFESWKRVSWPTLVNVGIISLLGVSQLYIQYFDKQAAIEQDALNATGGIPTVPTLLIVALILLSLGCAAIDKKVGRTTSSFALSYVLAVAGVTTLIAFINIYSTGTVQYFYIKSAALMCIILSVIITPFYVNTLVKWISSIVADHSVRLMIGAAMSIVIVGTVPLVTGGESLLAYSGKYTLGGVRHTTTDSVAQLLSSDNKPTTVILNIDKRIDNYYSNAFLGGVNDFNKCQTAVQTIGISTVTDAIRSLKAGCEKTDQLDIIVIDRKSVTNEVECTEVQQLLSTLTNMGVQITQKGNCS